MSENKNQRDIFILTDNVIGFKRDYLNKFASAGFTNEIQVEDFRKLDAEMLEEIDSSKNVIMFLFLDNQQYLTDLFLNGALIHFIENRKIDYLVVTDVQRWRSVEATFDSANNKEERTKSWVEGKNLFSASRLNPLIWDLRSATLPENIIYAFISDNDRFIDKLFDNLLDEIAEQNGNDGDNNKPIDSKKKLPLNEHLPKIFMGWIWRVWYKKECSTEDADKNEKEEPDLSVVSYVRRSVVVNMGDYEITYIHIKPSALLDLSEVINDFNKVYIDLNTRYSTMIFGDAYDPRYRKFEYTPFISNIHLFRYHVVDWLNVLENYLNVSKRVVGNTSEYKILDIVEDKYNDDLTKTVDMSDVLFSLNLPICYVNGIHLPEEDYEDEDIDEGYPYIDDDDDDFDYGEYPDYTEDDEDYDDWEIPDEDKD